MNIRPVPVWVLGFLKMNDMEKVSDFKVMDKIAEEGAPDGIAMFPTFLRSNIVKRGGELTFGIPSEALHWHLNESHFFMVYAVKKADFKRVKASLENEQST